MAEIISDKRKSMERRMIGRRAEDIDPENPATNDRRQESIPVDMDRRAGHRRKGTNRRNGERRKQQRS